MNKTLVSMTTYCIIRINTQLSQTNYSHKRNFDDNLHSKAILYLIKVQSISLNFSNYFRSNKSLTSFKTQKGLKIAPTAVAAEIWQKAMKCEFG